MSAASTKKSLHSWLISKKLPIFLRTSDENSFLKLLGLLHFDRYVKIRYFFWWVRGGLHAHISKLLKYPNVCKFICVDLHVDLEVINLWHFSSLFWQNNLNFLLNFLLTGKVHEILSWIYDKTFYHCTWEKLYLFISVKTLALRQGQKRFS